MYIYIYMYIYVLPADIAMATENFLWSNNAPNSKFT